MCRLRRAGLFSCLTGLRLSDCILLKWDDIKKSCEGGKYYLQDKYVRYYAALQLGVKEIHARIGTYNDHSIEDKIHRKGQRVQHEIFGKGTIINSTIDVVEIRFKSGKTKRLGIRKCIDEKMISFI